MFNIKNNFKIFIKLLIKQFFKELYLQKKFMKKLFLIICLLSVSNLFAQNKVELIIGKEKIKPGIVIIFEGAIKDHVMPKSMHLSKNETNIHIEARVNWDINNIPDGAVENGFIPYLNINAKITNPKTGYSTFIDLVPHINLIDNFHYARNISLPGPIDDEYSVEFNVIPPTRIDMSFHNDWLKNYGNSLIDEYSFKYENINFKKVSEAERK